MTSPAATKLARFLRRDLIWWLSPLLLVLGLVTIFLIVVEGSALAPLVYSMF
ncbi:MAG: DUF5989 family protein [bacterium]